MTKQQIKSFVFLSIGIMAIATISVIAWNKQKLIDVEEQVYWSILGNLFPDKKYPDNIAFMSMVTTCEDPKYIGGLAPTDVIDDFVESNGPEGSAIRLSFFEGIVPVADWESTKEVHNPDTIRSIPMNTEVAAISRAGLNEKRTKAFVCIKNLKSSHHDRAVFFYLEKNWAAGKL